MNKVQKMERAIDFYINKHLTYREIATLLSVSHGTVSNWLKKRGVAVHQGTWVARKCEFCGKGFEAVRSKVRKGVGKYCSQNCYALFLYNPDYVQSRQGQRLARAIVALHFALQPEHVVHHKDTDTRNNDLANLAVFASQADHLRWHRSKKVVMPIWSGERKKD